MTASASIRIVVLQDQNGLRRWHTECLAALRNIPGCEIVGVGVRPSNNGSGNHRYGLVGAIRRIPLPPLMRVVASPHWLLAVPQRVCKVRRTKFQEIFSDEDIGWIRSLAPTLILRFGFGIISGDILGVAPQGVWSFHHGDLEHYRGRPPTFWEVLKGDVRTGVTLQRLNEKLDGGEVLDKGFVAMRPLAPRGTLDRLYRCGAMLLRRSILRLKRNGTLNGTQPTQLGPVYRMPHGRDWVLYIWILARNAWTWIAEKSFFQMNWRIAILDEPPPLSGTHEISPRWLNSARHGFLADPCSLPGRSDRILIEHFDYRIGRGRIDLVELPSNGPALVTIATALDTGRHVSFPQAYSVDGQTWLVPETAAHGVQLAFRLDDDGCAIPELRRVIDGLSGVDPVLFQHSGMWWALSSPGGSAGGHILNAYFGRSFFGPYSPHPLNPVVLDSCGARPAGPVLQRNGELIRFGQAQGRYYGEGIEVFRIKTLDQDEYVEERIGSLRLESAPGRPAGTHGITFVGDRAIVDGYELVFSPMAGAARLWAKLRR